MLSFIEDNMVIIKVLGGISVIIVGMTILLKKSGRSDPPQPGRQRQQPVERLPVGVADYAGQSGLYPDLRRAVRGARRQPRGNPYANGLLMILGVLCGTSLWWFLLTFCIGILRRKFRPRHLLWMNRISGSVIVMLGAAAILSIFIHESTCP